MLKTILQNLSHSATFASLNSQSSKKTTWMQPQYSHLLPWATPASQRVAAHIALLLPRAASWATVQQTVSEKGPKISGFVGSNCTLKRTNYPIVSCLFLFSQFHQNLGAVALLTCWKVLNDSQWSKLAGSSCNWSTSMRAAARWHVKIGP